MEESFPIGTVVYLDDPADTYEVVGYWRGYVTVKHDRTSTTHKAPASSLTAVPTPESLGIDPTQDGWFTEYLRRTS